jgi:hypothetical protein
MLKLSRVLLVILAVAATSVQAVNGGKTAKAEPSITGQIQKDGLTVQQAEQVLVMVLKHEKLFMKEPGFNIENIEFVPGYVNFHVTYDTPKAGATEVIGAFAVSPRTGDVWETNLCKRYAFPALKRVQAAIMQRTGSTFASETNDLRGMGCADE